MRNSRAALAALAIAVVSQATQAHKAIRQPTITDLATVWVSSAPDAVEFLRLELAESGTGLLTVQFVPQSPARAYLVKHTTIDKYDVTFDVQSTEAGTEPVFLRGKANAARLSLQFGGTSGKWKRQVVLAPLEALMDRIEIVTKRADEVREHQP